MKRLTLVLMLLVPLIFFQTSHLLATWDVSPSQMMYEYSPGETFTVEISLSGSGNIIDALGFDFQYPSDLLQFDSAEFSGTLLDAWMYKQVNETTAGNLRVAGFTTSGQINSGTTGILVKLSFTVKNGASGEGQFTLSGFTDDLSGATTTPATFRTNGSPPSGNWDVSPSQNLYEYAPGETFTVEVELTGSGNTIDALGFDFQYPSDLLQFNSADFSGTLLDAWMYKQVNETTAGNLRVAGFTTSGQINSGTTGILVKLSFTVKNGASGEGQFTLSGFTDDLSGATTTAATFRANGGPPPGNWDVSPSQNLYEYAPGETFTVEVELAGSGSTIDALGFDFQYPGDLLQFNSADFSGTLLDAWMYKQVNETTAGNLRVAGFTTSGQINSGTTGILVKLSFTVKNSASGEDQFSLSGFTDDLNGATTTSAIFRIVTSGIHVAIADTAGTAGQTLLIPVEVLDDVTGMGILAFEVKVQTDTNIVTPIGIQRDGTMTASWSNIVFSISEGDITVGGANISELSGQGVLVYIEYQVNSSATAGQTSLMDLVNVSFNEGDPNAILQDGTFTVISGLIVSGNVHYYNGNKPISDVSLHLDDFETTSGSNGDYEFTNLLPGSYVLKPEKSGDVEHAISPFDAAKILQHSVGQITLAPMQMIAADVTGNGAISPFDASYVLQYSVGIVDEFPIGKDWAFIPDDFVVTESNWSDTPDSLIFDPLNTNMTDQDFTGIVYGDVTGNWQLFRPGSAPLSARIVVQTVETKDDEQFVVPVTVDISGDAISGKLNLQFNSESFEFSSVVLAEENIISAAKNQGDELSVVFAAPKTLSGKTLDLKLVFKKKGNAHKANLSVQFRQMILDDRVVNAEVTSEQNDVALPSAFRLDQNYPNPFNPETEISYQLPEKANVELTVFNLQGQKIKTLFAGQQEAGNYRAKWDALDETGNRVASGVYLCQLRAGKFVATRKMLLLR